MTHKQLLITGIDHDTTSAYALLDLNGNILKIESSPSLSIKKMIKEITEQGSPVIVATDKAKLPYAVEKIGASFGALMNTPAKC